MVIMMVQLSDKDVNNDDKCNDNRYDDDDDDEGLSLLALLPGQGTCAVAFV